MATLAGSSFAAAQLDDASFVNADVRCVTFVACRMNRIQMQHWLCRLVLMRDCLPQSCRKQLAEMEFKFEFIGMAVTMKVLSLFGKPSFC